MRQSAAIDAQIVNQACEGEVLVPVCLSDSNIVFAIGVDIDVPTGSVGEGLPEAVHVDRDILNPRRTVALKHCGDVMPLVVAQVGRADDVAAVYIRPESTGSSGFVGQIDSHCPSVTVCSIRAPVDDHHRINVGSYGLDPGRGGAILRAENAFVAGCHCGICAVEGQCVRAKLACRIAYHADWVGVVDVGGVVEQVVLELVMRIEIGVTGGCDSEVVAAERPVVRHDHKVA